MHPTPTPPDWQLPAGVSRGLWEYLHDPGIAEQYDASLADSILFTTDIPFVLKHCLPSARVVDLGCGTGRLLLALATQGHEATGVDLSAPMLEVARRKVEPTGSRVQLLQANLTDLSQLPTGHFDVAACLFSTLGMVAGTDNRQRVVGEARRLLRPAGRLVLHVHNRWFNLLDRHTRGWVIRNTLGAWLGRSCAGDYLMPPHQGIARVLLHLFTKREIVRLLSGNGFRLLECLPIGLGPNGQLRQAWLMPRLRAYGYLLAAERVG